jgi:hypothetical protein
MSTFHTPRLVLPEVVFINENTIQVQNDQAHIYDSIGKHTITIPFHRLQ